MGAYCPANLSKQTGAIAGTEAARPCAQMTVLRGLGAKSLVHALAGECANQGDEGRECPVGVQLVAAPWKEAALLRVAAALERDGVTAARVVA